MVAWRGLQYAMGVQSYPTFFCRWQPHFLQSITSWMCMLQRVLEVYEQASGQQLNKAKTSLFFSSNTPKEIQDEIKRRFGAQVIKQHEKYLGLPSLVGRNKRSTFNDIKEKLGRKLSGWKEKMLSKAGKEVLIKAMALAIPTYTISCFKLPDSLCDELTTMIRRFWWG